MKRTALSPRQKPMKRRAFAMRAMRKRKRVKKVLAIGRMKKGPAKSPEHLALVGAQPCLVSQRYGFVQRYPTEAHHVRECFPRRSMGRKISDYLTVPLARNWHSDQWPEGLHRTNNATWWDKHLLSPLGWIADFLAEHYPDGANADADEAKRLVAAELEKIDQRRAA